MGGLIDGKQKGSKSVGCWADYAYVHDINLGFSKSNFEAAISQEWKVRLTWNDRDVSRSFIDMAIGNAIEIGSALV